jgi:hypothetical protein
MAAPIICRGKDGDEAEASSLPSLACGELGERVFFSLPNDSEGGRRRFTFFAPASDWGKQAI